VDSGVSGSDFNRRERACRSFMLMCFYRCHATSLLSGQGFTAKKRRMEVKFY
jgi:hypothetical protein